MLQRRQFMAPLALALTIAAGITSAVWFKPERGAPACALKSERLMRLELVFGMGRKTAPDVTDAEWQDFLDTEVTPRFPQGLTVLTGYGQWRDARGHIAKEASRTLVVWFKPTAGTDAAVEAIRNAWGERHKQESVLKAVGSDCVSF